MQDDSNQNMPNPMAQTPNLPPETQATQTSMSPPPVTKEEVSFPSDNKKSHKNLIIIILGILVALVVVISVAFAIYSYMQSKQQKESMMTTEASPSPSPEAMMHDEMSDWKTYKNEYFQFKYPEQFIDSSVTVEPFHNTVSVSTEPSTGNTLAVTTIDNKKVEDRALEILEEPNTVDYGTSVYFGRDGRKIQHKYELKEGQKGSAPYPTTYLFQLGDNVIEIVDSGWILTDQILSTFEFSDSSN